MIDPLQCDENAAKDSDKVGQKVEDEFEYEFPRGTSPLINEETQEQGTTISIVLPLHPINCHLALKKGPKTTDLTADGLPWHLTKLLKGSTPGARPERHHDTMKSLCRAPAASSREFAPQ